MAKAERFVVQHFLPAERKKLRPLKNALSAKSKEDNHVVK
jgi:hypothetical protein